MGQGQECNLWLQPYSGVGGRVHPVISPDALAFPDVLTPCPTLVVRVIGGVPEKQRQFKQKIIGEKNTFPEEQL